MGCHSRSCRRGSAMIVATLIMIMHMLVSPREVNTNTGNVPGVWLTATSPAFNCKNAFIPALGWAPPKHWQLESHSSTKNTNFAGTKRSHDLLFTRPSGFKHGCHGFLKTSDAGSYKPGKKPKRVAARKYHVSPPPGILAKHGSIHKTLGPKEKVQQELKNTLLLHKDAEHLSLTLRLKKLLDGGLGNFLLFLSAMVSMSLANCQSTQIAWLAFWGRRAGPPLIGGEALTLLDWVNEGLMALFFFSVGLEIKKELTEGALASRQKAFLPCIAAVGGMIVPMLVYCAVSKFLPGAHISGATIPMATDIAFAMGIFSLFRNSMPQSAQSFLLALATVDDLGAIIVIAIFFAHALKAHYLMAAAAGLLGTAVAGRRGLISSSWGFIIPGVLMWYCLLQGGVNADIAGVLTAFCIPLQSARGSKKMEKLMDHWSIVAAVVILPVFALANCAVPVGEALPHTLAGFISCSAVPVGILLGLLIGKPLGIFLFSWLSVRLGMASMPPAMTKRDLGTVGVLGGIGFTMCLFLIENSLTGHTAELAKVAVFAASSLAALGGGFMMWMRPKESKCTS